MAPDPLRRLYVGDDPHRKSSCLAAIVVNLGVTSKSIAFESRATLERGDNLFDVIAILAVGHDPLRIATEYALGLAMSGKLVAQND